MSVEPTKGSKVGLVSRIVVSLFVIASIYVAVRYSGAIWHLITDKEALRDWIESYGIYGPILFILLQILQVVIFYIPGELTQIAGGYLFGKWDGLIYSTIGITIGSIIAFGFGRLFGRPFFEHIAPKGWVEKFDRIMNSKRALLSIFILFLLPGAPKDLLCYIAGFTNMSFVSFVLIQTPARMPNLILSSFAGSSLADENYTLFGIMVGLAVISLLLGYLIKKKFHIADQETNLRE